jgi:hypothetical protein
MPTEPLTLAALARFHRKVIAPDFERVVGRLDRIEARLGDIDSHFDAIYDRFQRRKGSLVHWSRHNRSSRSFALHRSDVVAAPEILIGAW